MNLEPHILQDSLLRTASWYRHSGIMEPADGSWGVAERILLTGGNESAQQTLSSFPAWTPHRNYCVMEQRRADCTLEAAFLFLELERVFAGSGFRDIAHNLLRFLYFRSGLLTRFGGEELEGTWNWSTIKREHVIYFDDNAWMLALALKIARRHPDFDAEFDMTGWAFKLAGLLADAFPRYFADDKAREERFAWRGKPRLPHWGSLVVMALAEAYRTRPDECYRKVADDYHDFLLAEADSFTVSEFGYVLLGAGAAYRAFRDEKSRRTALLFAEKILAKQDPATGSLPSEHYEAPSGKGLADTIYTLNWAVLGLQNMMLVAPEDRRFSEAAEKMLRLLLDIQDVSPEPCLAGCWRGMFDLEHRKWGGGNRFEGGADSIYSGWTNAPIPWAIAFAYRQTCLAEE